MSELKKYHGVFRNKNESFVFRATEDSLFVKIAHDKEILLTRDSDRVFFNKEYNIKIEFKENKSQAVRLVFILINEKTYKLKREVPKREKFSYKFKVNIISFLISILIILMIFLSLYIYNNYFKYSNITSSTNIEMISQKCLKGNVKSCKKIMKYYDSMSYLSKTETILIKACQTNESNQELHMLLGDFYSRNLSLKFKLEPFLQLSCQHNLSKLCYRHAKTFSDYYSPIRIKSLKHSCSLGYKKACLDLESSR